MTATQSQPQRRDFTPRPAIRYRRTVAGQHTAPQGRSYTRKRIAHWPEPAIEKYSRAPEPNKVWPALAAQRRKWYAGNPWTGPAMATAQRAAYDLMKELGAV